MLGPRRRSAAAGKRDEEAVKPEMAERKRMRETKARERMGNNHFSAAMHGSRARVSGCIGGRWISW